MKSNLKLFLKRHKIECIKCSNRIHGEDYDKQEKYHPLYIEGEEGESSSLYCGFCKNKIKQVK